MLSRLCSKFGLWPKKTTTTNTASTAPTSASASISDDQLALFDLVQEGDLDAIKATIEKIKQSGADLNYHHPKYHITPFHKTVLKGTESTEEETLFVLRLLVENNADINLASNDRNCYRPIHTAARRGLPRIVSWLIEMNVDLNTPDGRGKTPLEYIKETLAAKRQEAIHSPGTERLEEVEILLERHTRNTPHSTRLD